MMSTYDLAEIWVRFTEKIKESVSEKVFEIWINPIIPLEVTDNYYKVGVKNNFFKKMIEEKYAKTIEGILSSIVNKEITLIIETLEEPNDKDMVIEEIKAEKEPMKPLFNDEREVEIEELADVNTKKLVEILSDEVIWQMKVYAWTFLPSGSAC